MFSVLFCCLSFGFTFLFVIGLFLKTIKNKKSNLNFYRLEEITVIVPFRNEVQNLPKLLYSIQNMKKLPKEFIFINDHSEDDFGSVFENFKTNTSWKLVDLDADEIGKKVAIRKAISLVKTPYFLTWDADISINTMYFKCLEKTKKVDLLIMPVLMKMNRFHHFFYEMEYYFIPAISFGIEKILSPIVASGANLLIDKDKFLEFDSFEKHKRIASGDDMFTLSDFKKNNASISISNHSDLTAETLSVGSLAAFLQQRVRWAKKTISVNDLSANFIGILGFIIQISFLMALIFEKTYFLVLIKILVEFLLFFPYLILLKRSILLVFLPFFSIFYPFYLILIGILNLFLKSNWKGRSI